jgi:hypothetical protein
MKSARNSIALPDEADRRCSRCGAVVEPFGKLRQWFCVNQDLLLCVSCARAVIPDRVAVAELFKLYDDADGTDRTDH